MGTPLGFPDWSRQTEWDGPALLAILDAFGVTGSYLSLPINVSRFARLGGRMRSLLSRNRVILSWYADQGTAVLTGKRSFVLDPLVNDDMRFLIPNLGPWLTVQWIPNGAAAYKRVIDLFGSNRQQPVEVMPATAVPIASDGVVINGGATSTLWPTSYASGPARLLTSLGFAYTADVNAILDETGAVQRIAEVAGGAGQQLLTNLELPIGAWNVTFTNNGGNPSASICALTPSTTGG